MSLQLDHASFNIQLKPDLDEDFCWTGGLEVSITYDKSSPLDKESFLHLQNLAEIVACSVAFMEENPETDKHDNGESNESMGSGESAPDGESGEGEKSDGDSDGNESGDKSESGDDDAAGSDDASGEGEVDDGDDAAGNAAGGKLSFAVWGWDLPSFAPGLLVGWQCC